MSKARNILTDRDLAAYSKEHLAYEISMLRDCAVLLNYSSTGLAPALQCQLRNALLESFAIHVRNLVDFLYPTNVHFNDVLADDYFEGQSRPSNFPSLPSVLDEARKRAHKQVSHLTAERLAGTQPGKQWPLGEIVKATIGVLLEFTRAAAATKLDYSVRDCIQGLSDAGGIR